MPSDKCNSITAKPMGLIFLLFDITSSLDVPFEALMFIKCTLYGLTSALLCVPFILLTMKSVDFAVKCHSGYFNCRDSFQTIVLLYSVLNIASTKVQDKACRDNIS